MSVVSAWRILAKIIRNYSSVELYIERVIMQNNHVFLQRRSQGSPLNLQLLLSDISLQMSSVVGWVWPGEKLNPSTADEEVRDIYDKWAANYDEVLISRS